MKKNWKEGDTNTEDGQLNEMEGLRCGDSLNKIFDNMNQIQIVDEDDDRDKNDSEKRTGMKFIPKMIFKPQNMFFLRGGIFVDLSLNKEYSRVSNINFHTQIRSCSIIRSYGVVYTEFQTVGDQFDSHESAILTLGNSDNLDKIQLAEILKKHQINVFQDALVKQQVLLLIRGNSFMEHHINSKSYEFEQYRESMIKSLPRDRIFHFVDFGFDYNTMSLKILGEGYNDKFCNLMGCDIDTFHNITLRKGILEFKQVKMRTKLLNKVIEAFLESLKEYQMSGDIGIITLDDILIDCQFKANVYISPSYEFLRTFFHSQYQNSLFERGFAVIELLLTDFHVQKLNAIRKKYQKEETCLLNNNNNNNIQENILQTKKQIPKIEPKNKSQQQQNECYTQLQQFYDTLSEQSDDIMSDKLHQRKKQDTDCTLNSNNDLDNQESQASNELIPVDKQLSCFPCSSINSFEQTSIQSSILLPTKNINSSVSNLTTDIPYSMSSQFFIDRFYSRRQENLQQSHGDSIPRCGYRIISQQQQEDY